MRDRVQVLAHVPVKDAGGAFVSHYQVVAERWGLVEQLRANERLIAAAERVRISGRISMRYFEGLDETYRLVVTTPQGERTFGIGGVTNPDGRRIEHVCDVFELRGEN
jgi:head-tail adaptor